MTSRVTGGRGWRRGFPALGWRRAATVLKLALVLFGVRAVADNPALAVNCGDIRQFKGVSFEVCEVDLRHQEIHLYWKENGAEPYRYLPVLWHALERKGLAPVYAANAGMFEPDESPVGLHIEEGRILKPLNVREGVGNFYLRPNGVFLIDRAGRPRIVESRQLLSEDSLATLRLATQSGPLLVRHGVIHPRFLPASTNFNTRSAVGVRHDQGVVFVRSIDPCNFYTLATFFTDALGITDALYLDGAISESVTRANSAQAGDDSTQPFVGQPFVGMLAVTERRAF